MKQLVAHQLEKIAREMLEQHAELITNLIGKSHGIYALYDADDLYYVGKATDLKVRVKKHMKDKHFAGWTHFSLYLIENKEHVDSIESLLIRIANPKGNRNKPKAGVDDTFVKKLEKMLDQKHHDEKQRLFSGQKKKSVKSQKDNSLNLELKGKFKKPKELFKEYKSVEYRASLLPSGKIEMDGKIYNTPTGAAGKIVDSLSINGWTFWSIKDEDNNWVKLKELK